MITNHRRVRLYTASLGAAIALTAAACGSTSSPLAHESSQQAVNTSVSNLDHQSGFTATLSLGLTPSQLLQIQKISGGGGHLTPQVADAISKSSISMDVHTTNGQDLAAAVQSGKIGSEALDLAIHIGSDTPVELRVIGTTLYARINPKQALKDYGQNPALAGQLTSVLGKANTVVPGISALGQDKWVSADFSAFAGAAQQQGAAGAGSASKLVAAIRSAFNKYAIYAQHGQQGGATAYTVTIAAQGFVNQLVSAFTSQLPSGLFAGQLGTLKNAAQGIPASLQIVLQVLVKGTTVSEVSIDLNQFFHHKYPFAIPVRVDFTGGSTVSAPSGATALNLSGLLGALGSLGGASG
ncbi:MAG: hypothetical protein ACYC1D_16110 [Acidimicrobiales bacterium]